MSETFSGEGQALVVHDNIDGLRPFSSVWAYKEAAPGSRFSIVDYQNSVIGRRKLSSIFTDYVNGSNGRDYASDGLLNFVAAYYASSSGNFFVIVTITGVYNKCNYSSIEIDQYRGVTSISSKSVNNESGKKSISEEEFNAILDAHPFLREKYNEIVSKNN